MMLRRYTNRNAARSAAAIPEDVREAAEAVVRRGYPAAEEVMIGSYMGELIAVAFFGKAGRTFRVHLDPTSGNDAQTNQRAGQ